MYMTRIRNQAKLDSESGQETGSNVRDIYIYSAIEHEGWFGISAKKLVDELQDLTGIESIDVHINSEGGDVFDGIAIFNLLKNCGLPVNIHVEGMCASSASIIAMSGRVIMHTGAIMMIHNPFTLAMGNSEELRECADVLDKVRDSIIEAYISKTGLAKETLIDLMNRETWMNPQTAKDLGFCDEIDESKQEEQEQEPEPAKPENKSPVNFFAFGNKSKANHAHDEQEQAINLMAGYINGKWNH